MAKISFLKFQNSISQKAPTPKPTFIHHTNSKELIQKSGKQVRTFQPNTEELRKIFNKFDTNGDGKISLEEYKQALKILGGVTAKNEVAAQAFAAADADGDGFIDFEEFIKVHVTDGGVKNSEIEAAFRVFDSDADGKISAVELMEVLKRMGDQKYNLEACKKMIRGVDRDRDGDGLIDMDEFINMMQTKQTMKIM